MNVTTRWLVCGLMAGWNATAAVSVLRLPDGAAQPQAVRDSNGTIHLAWLQGDPRAADVFLWSLPGGKTNGPPPVRINDTPGSAIAIGTIRGVQIATGRDGWVHLVWNGSSSSAPAGAPTPLWYARRRGGVAGGGVERNLVGGTRHLDGGASVAADGLGRVHVIWHGAPGDAGDGEEVRRVFRALSADDGASFAPEQPLGLDAGVCACCSLRALADSEGQLWLLYRAFRPAPGDRPTLLMRSATGDSPWEPMLSDAWPALQCPMSSGFLGETPRGMMAVWETRAAIRMSVVPRRGPVVPDPVIRSLGQRARHPALALKTSGEALSVWAEGTGWQRGGGASWQILDGVAPEAGPPTAVPGLPVWSAPAAFSSPDGGWVVVF